MVIDLEAAACVAEPVESKYLNPIAILPYGCTPQHVLQAMAAFTSYLTTVNVRLHARGKPRLESIMAPANLSGFVSDFMALYIPRFCLTLVRNLYHNGRPDLLPIGRFPGDAVLRGDEGIELKASRTSGSWQGHNVENGWLMVFVIDSNRQLDVLKGVPPRPFHFQAVYAAGIAEVDWSFSGRTEGSHRTITAQVTKTGRQKMLENWIYRA